MGSITDAARAATAAAGVRAWGAQLGDAASVVGRVDRSLPFRPLSSADPGLATVDEALVRTVGYEMRDAVRQTNDNLCVGRALLGVHSLASKLTGGDTVAAMRNVGARDARSGAMLVAYGATLPGQRLAPHEVLFYHAAPVFQTTDGQLVVDHLLTKADDGVMSVDDWRRAIGVTDSNEKATLALVAATHEPPTSPKAHGGIPPRAEYLAAPGWNTITERLATSIERGANGLA